MEIAVSDPDCYDFLWAAHKWFSRENSQTPAQKVGRNFVL